MGWHLYLRDHRAFRRNRDGSWGWMRRGSFMREFRIVPFLETLEIKILGDGICDYDGVAEFARRYPIQGRKCGGKLRGCVDVEIDDNDEIKLANPFGRIKDDVGTYK